MYDAIVVGAGPAGAASAYYLARAGLKTLLIEKMRLPRFKPCGGAVSLKFLLSLPFDVSGAIRGKISRLRYFYNNADPFEVELDSQLATVNRQEFDQAIARAAAQAGAELIDGLAVSGLAIESQAIKVLTGKGIFETKYLIGADGVYSRIGEWSGLTKRERSTVLSRSSCRALTRILKQLLSVLGRSDRVIPGRSRNQTLIRSASVAGAAKN